jgi:hypothetical protein
LCSAFGVDLRRLVAAKLVDAIFTEHGFGAAVWDAEVGDIYEWCWMARFGHVEETRWRVRSLDLKKHPRTIHLFHKLGSQIRDSRHGPQWGG